MFQYAAFILWEGINTQLPQATLCMFWRRHLCTFPSLWW
jgi:hypothetical protein